MAHASQNKRSVFLEDVEILFHEKSNTLSIISRDPDLPVGEMFLKIKEGTPTDKVLRELFAEKTGNQNPLKDRLSVKPGTVTSDELRGYDKFEFPLGTDLDGKPVTVHFGGRDHPTKPLISGCMLIAGRAGGGKTVLLENMKRKAELWGIPFLQWDYMKHRSDRQEFDSLVFGKGVGDPAMVFIDGLTSFLRSSSTPDMTPKEQDVKAAEEWTRLLETVKAAPSRRMIFVFTEQRPEPRILKGLDPYLTAKAIGSYDTVPSAILLGDSSAVKLNHGQFILDEQGCRRQFQAYRPFV